MFRAVHPIKKRPCCKSQQHKPSIFRETSLATQAEESSLQGEPSPLMQCNLMDLPGRPPLQPKVVTGEQQTTGIAEKSASPVIQRYVRVGLYEGSFGLDHIGVGVNSEKTLGFSPKEGLGREAEKGSWVDGEVKEDHGLLDSLTIRTNPRQEARLQAALNRAESSPQKFNLRQHNCSQHGAEILKSAGLNAKSSPVPRAFFEGLKRQYSSGQKEAAGDGGPLQGKFASNASAAEPVRATPRPNRTGMPDRLKAGIESLSGMDLSDVRVHPNSELPARMDALAYTQGNQIYLGPGEERHLPHEAWHVVQQKQGRVRATRQMKGVNVNDDFELEQEAKGMGFAAISGGPLKKNTTDNYFIEMQHGTKALAQLAERFRLIDSNAKDIAKEICNGKEPDQEMIDAVNVIIAENGTIEFKNHKVLITFVRNRLRSDSESGSEPEPESKPESHSSEAAAVEDRDFPSGKEDRKANRRQGSGQRTDQGTREFKENAQFRDWVHKMKQKNQLVLCGVRNREGGADNLDKKELDTLYTHWVTKVRSKKH